jgi:4-amino-4-deoxy-L-arabinose transferase-like glycosyltransferase
VKTTLLAVFALALLALVFVADHDAWTPDEPRVVALASSVAHGSWVQPRLNGEPFLEQPSFHAWSVALAYRAFGETVTVARAVSVLYSVLTLLVTYLLGARLGSDRTGVLAALLLGTSFLFFNAEHRVTTDPPLAFFVAGSGYASLRALMAESSKERVLALLLAYAGASLAYLSKGLVGVGLSGFAFLACAAALRDPRALLRGHLWLAPVVFAAVTASYHVQLWRELGQDALRTVSYGQSLERMGTDSQHHQNVLYYLWSFPLNFLPTTLFFAGALRFFFAEREKLEAKARLGWEMPLAWFALGFVALSFAHSKREVYVLALLPAASVPSALWLEAVLDGRDRSLLAWLVPIALAVTLLPLGLALPAAALYLKQPLLLAVLGGLLAALASVASLVALRKGRLGEGLALVLGGALALVVGADLVLVPWGDAEKGLGPVIREAVARIPRDRAVYVLLPDETVLGAVPFYAGRDVAPIPTGLGTAKPLEEEKLLLAAHLHGERDLWALAVEKRAEPVVFESVAAFKPEVVGEWPGVRTVRLLHFRAEK